MVEVVLSEKKVGRKCAQKQESARVLALPLARCWWLVCKFRTEGAVGSSGARKRNAPTRENFGSALFKGTVI